MDRNWYVALNDDYVGPLGVDEIRAKLAAGEISIAHHVWRQGQESWSRICDTAEFRASLPKAPAKLPPPIIEEAAPAGRQWFLHYNKTQYGPLAQDEVEKLLEVGQVDLRTHAWSEGMSEWLRIEKIEAFARFRELDPTLVVDVPQPPKFAPRPAALRSPKNLESVQIEHRDAVRRPLRAKLILSDDKTVNVATSHDISMGGMQVETDEIPGPVGARIKLNVTPSAQDSSGKPLPAFVAKGVIVRIREDRRGFCFKFDELSENARKAIQRFVS